MGKSDPRATRLRLHVGSVIPIRNPVYVVASNYMGVDNITDHNFTVSWCIGEARFAAVLVNVSTWELRSPAGAGRRAQKASFVQRSAFFGTRLYGYLNDSNPIAPLNKLTFRQNDTAASSNSDVLQQILTGNVTEGDAYAIFSLLLENETGYNLRIGLTLTNDLFLYSLPDDAVRFVGYDPRLTACSWTYTFSSGTTTRPWWELVWTGIVTTVTSLVTSAVVLAATAFARLVEVAQLGAWLWSGLVGAGQAVASAMEAAGEAFLEMVDALADAILAVIHAALDPLIDLVTSAYEAWANDVARLVMTMPTLSVDDSVRGLIELTFFSAFALAIFAVVVAFSVAEKITNAMSLGLANLAGIVIGAVTVLIIGMLVVAAINEWLGSTFIEDLLPPGFDGITGATFTVAQFLFAYELAQRPLKPVKGVETALKDSIVALMLLGVSTVVEAIAGTTSEGLVFLVVLDVVAMYVALSGLRDMLAISGQGANLVRMWYPFLYPVTVAMNAIGIATTATELATDAGRLEEAVG